MVDGSVAVAVARGRHARDPRESSINLLVPVTGNEASRRGAEIAVELAKTVKSPLMVLSVLTPGMSNARERLGTARRDAAEVIREIREIADFHDVPVKSAMRTDISPAEAILRQARRGGHDLVVLGVSRRPGKALSFGELATALLESSDRSLLFVAPQASTRRGGGSKGGKGSEQQARTA